MDNMTFKISEESNDLEFDENGMLKTIGDNETAAQNIRMTLTAWKEDFEPVPEHGTDYKKFFSEDCTDEEREEILRDAILQEENVKQVENMDISNIGERSMTVSFAGTLDNGYGISMEVNTQ